MEYDGAYPDMEIESGPEDFFNINKSNFHYDDSDDFDVGLNDDEHDYFDNGGKSNVQFTSMTSSDDDEDTDHDLQCDKGHQRHVHNNDIEENDFANLEQSNVHFTSMTPSDDDGSTVDEDPVGPHQHHITHEHDEDMEGFGNVDKSNMNYVSMTCSEDDEKQAECSDDDPKWN